MTLVGGVLVIKCQILPCRTVATEILTHFDVTIQHDSNYATVIPPRLVCVVFFVLFGLFKAKAIPL